MRGMDANAKTRWGRWLLALSAWWNFAFAVLHVVIIFMGGAGYRYFGAGEGMARAAEMGSLRPTIITSGLTAIFFLFGVVMLSAAGQTRRLPAVRWVALAIGVLYVLRGVLVAPQAWWAWQHPGLVPLRFVIFSAVALLLGLAGTSGTILRWTELRAEKAGTAGQA